MNLIDPILWHARKQPHAPALVEQEQILSYDELADRVLRTATHLAELGVGRGDLVGLCLRDDTHHIITLLATAYIGATAVQIDGRARPTERARIVDAWPLRLALVTPESEKGINCPRVVLDTAWNAAVAAADRSAGAVQDWNTSIAMLASSGTTGLPKFTVATHLEYHFHVLSYLEVIPPGRHRYLSTLPLYFSAGRVACMSHLLRGDTVVLHPLVFSSNEFINSVSQKRITVTFLVPSMLRQLLSIAGNHQFLLPEIDLLITGGAPLFADEKREVLRKVTPRFCEMYGTAAMGPMAALCGKEVAERPTSVGRPFSFVEIEIVSDRGERLALGATGHLRCRGPGLTLPTANASKDDNFSDGWYYPGELANVDDLGYIFLQGRTSEVVFRGGAKIFPSEVEAVLQEHESVVEAAVVGRALSNNEQELVAYVVISHPLTAGELFAYCRTRLAAFKVPREIHIVTDLPRNLSGKVDKRVLATVAANNTEFGVGD